MGSKTGVIKIAAARIGVPLEDYLSFIADGQKWCHKCRSWKPTDQFCVDQARGDGRHAVCSSCRYVRKTAGPPKAKRREMRGKGFAWCRMCGAWLKSTEVRAGTCRPHANEYARSHYAGNPTFKLTRLQRGAARRRGVNVVPREGIEILMEEFGGKCAYCGGLAQTWDHIVPVSCGGQTTPGNTVPACKSCNSSKKARDLDEWMAEKGYSYSEALINRLILAECGFWG